MIYNFDNDIMWVFIVLKKIFKKICKIVFQYFLSAFKQLINIYFLYK
jgi:hypothetical protein